MNPKALSSLRAFRITSGFSVSRVLVIVVICSGDRFSILGPTKSLKSLPAAKILLGFMITSARFAKPLAVPIFLEAACVAAVGEPPRTVFLTFAAFEAEVILSTAVARSSPG